MTLPAQSARSAMLTLFMLLALSLTACREEALEPDRGPFGDLTSRDHTIENLQLAYEARDMEEFARLPSADFTFCHMPDETIVCLDRAETLAITDVLFGAGGLLLDAEPVDRVEIAFTFAAGASNWIASTTPDPRRNSDAKTYEKTVDYVIRVTRGGETAVWDEPGRATFIVLVADLEGRPRWRIFGIADHGGGWGALLAAATPPARGSE